MQPQSHKILISDDEASLTRALTRFLEELGFEVKSSFDEQGALSLIEREQFDAALIDLKLGDKNGIDLIQQIKKRHPETICIIFTGYASIESAVQAMKAGAYDYIKKPFHLDDLQNLLAKAFEDQSNQIPEFSQKKAHTPEKSNSKRLVGEDPSIQEVYRLIEKVADTDSTVLILGESGTGKELVAQAIHNQSTRSNKPLVSINCGAIPEELLESELFGHVKGAFTGAVQSRPGRFATANGSTLFLDEIGDMSLKLQVKLLRALQEKKFEPVGSNQTLHVNARIIAATNKNLEEAVKQHRFREDLYYRLHVIPIELPPLRARKNDVPLLIQHFCQLFGDVYQRPALEVSPEAMELFKNYSWPGNIRELENLIERLTILQREGCVEPSDLVGRLAHTHVNQNENRADFLKPIDLKYMVDDFEKQLILQALSKTEWNKNKAAQLLGLNRTTLIEKIKKRGLEPLEEVKVHS